MVPAGMKSLGLAVPSVKSSPAATPGQGEQQADRCSSLQALRALGQAVNKATVSH